MKRNPNHLIGEDAEDIFRPAMKPWLVNRQLSDYGKDYLVEVADAANELTSEHVLVQLKGQKKPALSIDRQTARFQLKSKYAKQYHQTHDLPVFLVLVDVVQKQGWYVFLQPILQTNAKWRKQKSVAVYIPLANSLSDLSTFRQAIDDAKKWLRVNHAESIQESFAAHRQRIRAIDPRFDLEIASKDGVLNTLLVPNEEVPLNITVSATTEQSKSAFLDFGKGLLASGEGLQISVEGSPLFDARQLSAIQCSIKKDGDCSLTCRNSSGKELASISRVPGMFSGGLLELEFKGILPQSPLKLTVGPIKVGESGKLNVNLKLAHWDDQRLRYLAHFDMLHDFFTALPGSAQTTIECRIANQLVFSTLVQLQTLEFVKPFAYWFSCLWKARKIAEHFKLNPYWSLSHFDEESCDTIEQLYAIIFENGWRQRTPTLDLTFACDHDAIPKPADEFTDRSTFIMTSMERWELLGEMIDIGWIHRQYDHVVVEVDGEDGLRSDSGGARTVDVRVRGQADAIMGLKLLDADQRKLLSDRPKSASTAETPTWTLGGS